MTSWQQMKHRRLAWLSLLLVVALAVGPSVLPTAQGQDASDESRVNESQVEAGEGDEEAATESDAATPDQGISLLTLVFQGGVLMLPIFAMSMMVLVFTIERFLGLRRSKVLPVELVEGLGELAATPGGFDPRKAYRLCQSYPSACSTVIRAMLLKVGRPHSEVEHAVAEASEREAQRLYANVRWLVLASAVAPLLGLFGTVWGMIRAFRDTTLLAPGQNKADFLAEGIYIALVTTLGGLAVAIPAAIFAHYFEGRIQSLFHQIDELLFNLLPQIERYEGRLRVSRQALGEEGDGAPVAPPMEPPVTATAVKGN